MNNAERQKRYRDRQRNAKLLATVTKRNETVTRNAERSDDRPEGVDKALWAQAEVRAERAKRYACKFPSFVKKGEEIFQTVEWQYGELERYDRRRRGQSVSYV